MAHADTSHYMLKDPPWERELANNPAWVAAMDRAFSAPRFHDYFAQQVDLGRQACTRYHISDSGLVGYVFFGAGPLESNMNIEAYSRFLVRSGDEAAQHRNWSQAIQNYEKVEQFAEKIPNEDASYRWLAAKIGGMAAKKLEFAYDATNHPKEAKIAATKFASWDKTSAEFQSRSRQDSWGKSQRRPWLRAERAGFVINLAVVLITIVLPLTVVALLCVALAASYSRRILGQLYRLVCLAADVAPVVLVLSFALLFFAYRPYAHPFENAPSRQDLWAAAAVPHVLPRSVGVADFDFFYIHGRYYFWVGLTSALSLIALFLLYRITMKKRRS